MHQAKTVPEAKTEEFLSREQIAEAMTNYIRKFMPDEEITPEKVVEIPASFNETFSHCKVWCACCGPFIIHAVNTSGLKEPAIYVHS